MTPPSDEQDAERFARIRPYLGVDAGELAEDGDGPSVGLRPFVLTGGRVSVADPDIGVETQVTARSDGPQCAEGALATLPAELRTIVSLCDEPVSVAEISARARLHLGVTRVLVGDLRAAGYLDVHVRDTNRPADPDLILRVIHGLRTIS